MPAHHGPENRKNILVNCCNCSLNELCIPRGLGRQEIERIAGLVERRKVLRKGEFLYRQGDPFRGILAIKGGTAKTVFLDPRGNEYLMSLLLPGELLGFDALADNFHNSSAVALETLSFCEIPADEFDSLCHDAPNLSRSLFRRVAESLAAESERNILSRRTAQERVACFLADISDRLSRRGLAAEEFKLSLSRQEIGNYLGLALETVSRIINDLEEMGLIRVKAKLIRILDRDGLRAIYSPY